MHRDAAAAADSAHLCLLLLIFAAAGDGAVIAQPLMLHFTIHVHQLRLQDILYSSTALCMIIG
jgi:hypothetical protein